MRLFSPTSYNFPIAISVLAHGVLIGFIAWGWQASSAERKTVAPKYIEAKLVELEATSTKRSAPKPKPKVIDLSAQQAKKEQERKAAEAKRIKDEAARQAKAKADAERKEKERIAQEAAAEKARKEKEAQEAQQRFEQELADSLAEEDELLFAQESEATAQSYAAMIQDRIRQNWSRPPSARNGMKCRLLIRLVPTGRVVNVTITESSGNDAFDRSAEQAVWKAEQFPELQKVESTVFERHLRELSVLFEPQDLRL